MAMLLIMILFGCGHLVHYFGDTYDPTTKVDVYYNAKEISRSYKTIGRMTKDVIPYDKNSKDKKEMVEAARRRGADGIIFSDLSIDSERKSSQVSVKAELIKYTE